jgi:hypothetical protein
MDIITTVHCAGIEPALFAYQTNCINQTNNANATYWSRTSLIGLEDRLFLPERCRK